MVLYIRTCDRRLSKSAFMTDTCKVDSALTHEAPISDFDWQSNMRISVGRFACPSLVPAVTRSSCRLPLAYRWRFSLRTLLIATTLVAVVLGLIVWLLVALVAGFFMRGRMGGRPGGASMRYTNWTIKGAGIGLLVALIALSSGDSPNQAVARIFDILAHQLGYLCSCWTRFSHLMRELVREYGSLCFSPIGC